MDTKKIEYDQLKKSSWSEAEEKNVKLIVQFIQKLMNNHDFEGVMKKFNNSKYKQHNRGIVDGFEAIVEYVKKFTKLYPHYTYDVKHIYADGDYVVFHSHITTHKKHRGNDKKGINVIDSWKIQNGQIVEHWDALQPMSPFLRFVFWVTGGKIANSNGVF